MLKYPMALIFIFLPVLWIRPSNAQSEKVARVRFDSSRCDYCRMIFQDKGFGGEVETTDDSVLVFDATECLAAFLISEKLHRSGIRQIWSVDHTTASGLIDAQSAWYLRSDKILSPMSAGLAAFGSKHAADSAMNVLGGEVLGWKDVVNLIRVRWYKKEPIK
jgi:copper chaperone NosL